MFLVLKRWQDGKVHFRAIVPLEQGVEEEGAEVMMLDITKWA